MTLPVNRRALVMGGVAIAAGAAGVGVAFRRHGADIRSDVDALDGELWTEGFDRPNGGRLDLASYRGKALLLNFWATWCPPCVEELPMIDRFFAEQAANGWQVVGLAVDRQAAVEKFLARIPVRFPVGITGLVGTELMKRLGNTGGGLPFTLVVSASNKVVARKMGKLDTADLEAWRHGQLRS